MGERRRSIINLVQYSSMVQNGTCSMSHFMYHIEIILFLIDNIIVGGLSHFIVTFDSQSLIDHHPMMIRQTDDKVGKSRPLKLQYLAGGFWESLQPLQRRCS